ncbi:hypothetical protein [Pseudomonas sp. ICMP 561]|uniref:hypothetical protein n=1 Tax=Pseudomonas sp. ICMP 561 TaxID=1718918 RepID=UPI000C06DF4F|nr:hypothetical protein [Pseudomonas sp. ICMP 561]PHN26300.1 hypothetical protein AO242_26410 [Pseudomonas sp. ICMP 561]
MTIAIPDSPLLTSLSATILISFAQKWNFFILEGRERFLFLIACDSRMVSIGHLAAPAALGIAGICRFKNHAHGWLTTE